MLAACYDAGFTGVLVEGVDNALSGEWIAARTAQVARREALRDAPKVLRLTDRLQLAAWEEVLRRVAAPITTGQLAHALRVTREHLSREFAAGGAPNLKRVIDLARAACAADLLGNPGYSVRGVVWILGYASSSHLAAVGRDLQMTRPFARLLGRLALQLFKRAGSLQLPLPQDLQSGNLRQVKHVQYIRSARSHGNPGVMVRGEIAHRVRHQRDGQSRQKRETRQFHYNSP